jgi:2-polyprenyl-6-methoxyphenol hydroxylase-like FAD-dependent oxidoreductase
VALATPTDGGLTLCAVFPAKKRLAEFKADTEAAIRSTFECLPDVPPLAEARHVGPIVGKVDLTNERRRAAGNRTALIGDAAMAADPVGAIGCGWALQSAEWLAVAVGPALVGDESLARALRRYRRRHRQGLLGHFLVTSGSARAKPMAPPERLIFSAAVHDSELAGRIEAFAARTIGPRQFLTPGTFSRAVRVKLTTRRSRAARRHAAAETP